MVDDLVLAYVANKLLCYNATLVPIDVQYNFVIEFAHQSDQALFKLTWM